MQEPTYVAADDLDPSTCQVGRRRRLNEHFAGRRRLAYTLQSCAEDGIQLMVRKSDKSAKEAPRRRKLPTYV